jgi:hypothetical protein
MVWRIWLIWRQNGLARLVNLALKMVWRVMGTTLSNDNKVVWRTNIRMVSNML